MKYWSLWFISVQDGKISSKNEGGDEEEDEDFKVDEIRPQPWYFHIVASFILVNSQFEFILVELANQPKIRIRILTGKIKGSTEKSRKCQQN